MSVGPNHLGSHLISRSVNTSASPAKEHTSPINEMPLESRDAEKDVGVWVSSNLTSDNQLTEQCAKANNLRGFVRGASRYI